MPCLNFQHKMSKQASRQRHERKETFIIGLQTSSSSQLQLFCFNVSDNITYAFIFFLGCSSVHLRYGQNSVAIALFSSSFLISNYLIQLL
ncbi:hypothetical protein OIU79_020401 [Salix purpurea]|uniref:Uncharacterized protein n=1 Tax=Salix purpurea TaxID=77065 RepID=A0A9Q1AFQ3_SALPP|nr:hypothetical protein OIU79_020401 [Salix purpurea]